MRLTWLLLALLSMLSIGHSATAKSARHWLRQGNEALAAADFDAALEAYGKAELDAPESPYLAYNQGIVWYRQGDFNRAREHFQRANANLRLLRRPDDTLAARSEIAIGNSWFREAQRQQDSNLQKCADAFTESIAAYDRCLNLQPNNKIAQQNRQAARLLLKKIWAEQAQQQLAQQQKQEKMQELAQRLAELTKRQQEAAEQSQSLSTDGSSAADKQQVLSQDTQQWQEDFQAETGSDMLPANDDSPQDGTAQEINEEVAQARQAQQQAEANLRQQQADTAHKEQLQAAKHLQNALDKWQQEQQEQQEQQQQENAEQQQEQSQKEDGQQQDNADEENENGQQAETDAGDNDEQQTPPEEQQVARELTDQEAQDILDQEKTDKRRRQTNQQKKYVPVAKDW